MKTEIIGNATAFLAQVGARLESEEVRWGLMRSLADRLSVNPHQFGELDPWFLVARDGDEMCAVAMRTPPHNLIVAHFGGECSAIAESLTDVVLREFGPIPGVIGDKELATRVAEVWCRRAAAQIQGTMPQRIYQLLAVSDTPSVPGKLRIATADDKPLVQEWSHAFHADVFGENANVPEDRIESYVDSGDLYLWDNGGPVSMAARSRPVGAGIAVNAVYTPPEHRRSGYATACVAALCRLLLSSGYRYCTLYADLGNPTSNGVYRRIGFREVCDSVQIAFG